MMKTAILISIALMASSQMTSVASAQTVVPVQFKNEGQTLKGQIYLPQDYKKGSKVPGVVITGAWMTVKEQMPRVYALEMAKRGYAAMIFDFRGWGESKEGKAPKYMESAPMKISDIKAAAAFLAKRPEVSSPVSGLGICASAGYMAQAVVDSKDFGRMALVAPWLHNQAIVEQVYGGKAGVEKLVQASKNPQIALGASKTDQSAIMFNVPYYTETNRGEIPEWDNKFNTASWKDWLTFDAVRIAKSVRKPTLIVHSEAAAIPQGAKEFYGLLSSAKKEVWLDKVSQFDFYDRPDAVTKSSDLVAEYLRK